jgi:uncharacterized protein (UPF0332 family)
LSKKLTEEYCTYRLLKAKDTLKEIDILIENKLWNTAINRMYYATFYAVTALLINDNIKTTSHVGTKIKFSELYIKENKIDKKYGKLYSLIFEKRHKGDYDDFIDYEEETILELQPKIIEFVEVIIKYIG